MYKTSSIPGILSNPSFTVCGYGTATGICEIKCMQGIRFLYAYICFFISFRRAITESWSFWGRLSKICAARRVFAEKFSPFAFLPVTRYSTETPRAFAIATALVALGSALSDFR